MLKDKTESGQFHNFISLYSLFQDLQKRKKLTDDEYNLIIFLAVDKDWLNNLIIKNENFNSWFETDFEGDSK